MLFSPLGGQTGLNLSASLAECGALKKYNVRVIGVEPDAIRCGEDRLAFKETMMGLGIEMPKSSIAYDLKEAEALPITISPLIILSLMATKHLPIFRKDWSKAEGSLKKLVFQNSFRRQDK
jgi:carbamoylphosphate synthase large subunit